MILPLIGRRARAARLPRQQFPAGEPIRIEQGRPAPLGATPDAGGVNFSVYSSVATRVELCLFVSGRERRIDLPMCTDACWHGYVPGLMPGQAYGFRVHGPWAPDQGHRCNPHKLLLDPYARIVAGRIRWTPAMLPYRSGSEGEVMNTSDNARAASRSVVSDAAFDWQDDRPPATPLSDTVIYEVHVKGFSIKHPDVPSFLRGTYAGLAHPAMLEHLRRLGVTAVELLPVQAFVSEPHLTERGLVNYWGYNTIGFFAPHASYASAGPRGAVREFKTMVRALHAAGLEVLLDVVYNHTPEGNHLGPMLSLKGLDNAAYYRLVADNPRHYVDCTGTGNALNLSHPQAVQLVLDSLRYWTAEMHVDGFRFDLAATLGRGGDGGFDARAAFFTAVHQDPALARVKLIAEPWDVGDGGYQLGHFPVRWSEWNDRFRDSARDYWRSQPAAVPDLATRLTGSADVFQHDGRGPLSSVNFVTAHDGFTLRDLVSFNEKHNEANGEENHDGADHNRSWNLGAEGPTDDSEITARRERQVRNLLTTLLLARGVPMMLSGDEIGRTQHGNNNAYCQDNDVTWLDWEHADQMLLAFTRRAIELRRTHRLFRSDAWSSQAGHEAADVRWLMPGGQGMTEADWEGEDRRAFAAALTGTEPSGRKDYFVLLFNAALEPVTFRIPALDVAASGLIAPVLDTASPDGLAADTPPTLGVDTPIERPPLSLLVARYLV